MSCNSFENLKGTSAKGFSYALQSLSKVQVVPSFTFELSQYSISCYFIGIFNSLHMIQTMPLLPNYELDEIHILNISLNIEGGHLLSGQT